MKYTIILSITVRGIYKYINFVENHSIFIESEIVQCYCMANWNPQAYEMSIYKLFEITCNKISMSTKWFPLHRCTIIIQIYHKWAVSIYWHQANFHYSMVTFWILLVSEMISLILQLALFFNEMLFSLQDILIIYKKIPFLI